ncbi:uncharacterized protein LTR77_008537 [Saxophila tyrrhenica]|uniref:Uncharacterized protein n=1 Tax=Saxophila tyrrhenica TaxID=1690608 RepID=A0AAV9P196_9PEZI|nr:hypothetical protein LTR77_008537 [Saxophila tyrrhenica]
MANPPDLTLPDVIPEMRQYHDQPEDFLPFALYTLCELDDKTLERYRQRCASRCDDDTVKLPPKARFVGETLRQIVASHVQLGREGNFDPIYLLVCVYADSDLVLVVTLDDHDLECRPGQLWTSMERSGLMLQSLNIWNTDWFAAKENSLAAPSQPENEGGDVETAPDTRRSVINDSPDGATDNENDQQDQDYGTPPPLGFHIQVYTTPDVEQDSLIEQMEPGSSYKKADRSDWGCKAHRLTNSAKQDSIMNAARIHPYRCLKHPTLEKKYFIVADEANYADEGVAIVHLDWNGRTERMSADELHELGGRLDYQVQRAEVPDNASRAVVATVCMLAQGYEKWQPKVKQFAIYYPNASDADIKLADAIDPKWVKRGHGQERVALGGSMQGDEIESGGGFWPAFIRRHVAYCKRQRFVPAFVRPYFIHCGVEEPSAESEVQVIKLDWDGDLRLADVLAEQYRSKTSVVKTSASTAYGLLTDVVNGKVEWQGVTIS